MGEPFCVSERFWYQKFLDNWGITILSNYFVSRCQKSSRANRSVFHKYSGIKLFLIIGISRFCRLLCLTMPKFFVGGPLFFGKFLVSKKFWITSYHHLMNFFVSRRRKSSWANPSVFQKYSGFNIFCIIMVSFFCRLFLYHSAEKLGRTLQ